jgi:hypothetical protein
MAVPIVMSLVGPPCREWKKEKTAKKQIFA